MSYHPHWSQTPHVPKDDFELLTRPFQMLRVQAYATTPDQIHFYCVNIVFLKVEISANQSMVDQTATFFEGQNLMLL